MGELLVRACRTLEAYTVAGAWDRGWCRTERRAFGPGARSEAHARRRKALALLRHGQARRVGVNARSLLSPPPPSPHPRLGEGGGGERRLCRRAGRRRAIGTRPAAW